MLSSCPSPSAENQLTQSCQWGNFYKMRDILLQLMGFSPVIIIRARCWGSTGTCFFSGMGTLGPGGSWSSSMTSMAGTKPFLLIFLPTSLPGHAKHPDQEENLRKTSLASSLDCFLLYPTPLFWSKIGKKRGKGMSLKISNLLHKSCYLGREP